MTKPNRATPGGQNRRILANARSRELLAGSEGVDINLAVARMGAASDARPPGEAVVSMRPLSAFAKVWAA
jgi:hypothetical protein